jgi:hypothetical protein
MKTKAQALADLAVVVREALLISRALTPRQAAERAWHPGGPSVEELTETITKNRQAIARRAERKAS